MRIRGFFVLVLGLTLLGSCSKKNTLSALHPVKGVVTKNGQAVNGGVITLNAEPNNPVVASAVVGGDGRFEILSSHADDKEGKKSPGAPEGTYTITYSPPLGGDQSIDPITPAKTFKVEATSNEWTVELVEKK